MSAGEMRRYVLMKLHPWSGEPLGFRPLVFAVSRDLRSLHARNWGGHSTVSLLASDIGWEVVPGSIPKRPNQRVSTIPVRHQRRNMPFVLMATELVFRQQLSEPERPLDHTMRWQRYLTSEGRKTLQDVF